MKALLLAGLAVGLAGSSLQAQEPPGSPVSAPAQTAPAGQEPSVQQLLQMVSDLQRQAAPGNVGANPPADQKTEASLVQQVIRLALLEITQLQQKLKEDDGGAASAPRDAAAAPMDGANPPAAAPSLTDEAFAKLAHAWDSSLSTGGLRTGGLQTGSLQTGSLQTGHLSTGYLPSGAATNWPRPSRNVVQTAVVPSGTAPADALPADPDDAMLRWSQRIDGQYADEQAARRAAVRLYPALAVTHSAFNRQFLACYAQYRQADPFGFLRGPGWPMKLAIVTANDLQRRGEASP